MIVDGGMGGDELLQRGRASESLHGSLLSSERLMGVLGTIVQPPLGVLASRDAEIRKRRSVGAEAVGDDGAW